jgi:hypothetical protein
MFNKTEREQLVFGRVRRVFGLILVLIISLHLSWLFSYPNEINQSRLLFILLLLVFFSETSRIPACFFLT